MWRCLLLCAAVIITSQNVTAQNPTIQNIRLAAGATANELEVRDGRVEVQYRGIWGTVCSDGFDAKDAGVVCRMLGYTHCFIDEEQGNRTCFLAYRGVAVVQTQAQGNFGPGNTLSPVHLDNLDCEGNEATLDSCDHVGVGSPSIDCNHNQDVGVFCLGGRGTTVPTTTPTTTTTTQPPRICNTPSQNVQLVSGPNEAVGRVQVRRTRSGPWQEICDDRWGKEDAMVICRMLCYNPDNAHALLGGTYGNATAGYALDDLQCTGRETDIFTCPANAGQHNCAVTEAAAVSCMEDDPTARPLPEPEIDCVVPEDRIVVKFSRAVEPHLRTQHLTLTNGQTEGCGYTRTSDNDYIIISIPFIGCGTARELNYTHIIYSNRVHYDVPPAGVITRSEVYDINVFCLMGRNGDPEEGIDPEALTPPPKYGVGHPDLTIRLYTDNRFNTPIVDLPAQITLGTWVHVGVVLTTTDPDLKVVVQSCFTTPDENRTSTPRYDLIVNKCASEETITFYPINETFFGFRFLSFRYYEGNYDHVYIHCKGIICDLDEKTGRCDSTCGITDAPTNTTRRRRDAVHGLFHIATDYVSDLVRSKRQISSLSGLEVEGDEGPIYLVDPNMPQTASRPTTPSVVTPGFAQVVSTTPSMEDMDEIELQEDIENSIVGTIEDKRSSADYLTHQLLFTMMSMLLALLVH